MDKMTGAEHEAAGHIWSPPPENPSDIGYSPMAQGRWETQEQRTIRTLRGNIAVLIGALVVVISCFVVYVRA